MFNKVLMSMAAAVALSACSACSIQDEDVASSAVEAENWGAKTESSAVATSDSAMKTGEASTSAVAMPSGNMVHFGFNSAALSKASQEHLKKMAAEIKATNPSKITVEGHCDERGTREYNLALGDRRAVSAKKYLVGLGVDSSKITTISYGKERPIDPAHNAAAWAKNRRATVVTE